MLPLDCIRRDFQDDEFLIEDSVNECVVAFHRGDKIEPIRVFFDGAEYWLADGFHRVAAALRVGRREIEAAVVLGTYADMDAEWREGLEAIKRYLRGESED